MSLTRGGSTVQRSHRLTATAVGCFAAVLLVAACGAAAAAVRWRDLRSVRVTVSNPSLAPPFGKPQTTVFHTKPQLTRVQAALNAHRIRRVSQSSSDDGGCTGGYDAVITIVQRDGARVRLSAYRCAETTYGTIGGDLNGFLTAVGIPLL
jgi:hypothetical protein